MSQNVCKSGIISLQTQTQAHTHCPREFLNVLPVLITFYFSASWAFQCLLWEDYYSVAWVVADVSCGQVCSACIKSAAQWWQVTLEWLGSSWRSWGLVSGGLGVSREVGRTVVLDSIEPPPGVALESVFPDEARGIREGWNMVSETPHAHPGALLPRSCRRQRGW